MSTSVSTVSVLSGSQERVQSNGDSSITPGAVLMDRNDQRTALVAQTPVPLQAPPTFLAAGGDTVLTFTATAGEAYAVRRLVVQNKSGRGGVAAATVYLNFDAAATAGDWFVDAGQTVSFDVPCNVLHVYCAAALGVGGTADGNLRVGGWL